MIDGMANLREVPNVNTSDPFVVNKKSNLEHTTNGQSLEGKHFSQLLSAENILLTAFVCDFHFTALSIVV
jgi:hypothetical protein